jgi:hypothetical protein
MPASELNYIIRKSIQLLSLKQQTSSKRGVQTEHYEMIHTTILYQNNSVRNINGYSQPVNHVLLLAWVIH